MPNRPATPPAPRPAPEPAPQQQTPPEPEASPWSPAQLVRLQGEWRKLQRSFAYHPAVRVVPLAGDPPGEYQIEYKLRTLIVDEAGELSYVDQCAVHLWLPPQFPHAPPVARPMFGAFHPNVSHEWIHLDPPWHPSSGSLVDVVRRCGELLAYQVYDPDAVYNPTAMEWVSHYPHLLPTDPHAVLAPEAGGDPLGRIIRHGTQTLEQFKSQLTEMSLGILEGRPNTATPDVQAFGERLSVSMTLFSEPDIPDPLRSLASELDEWARSMTPPKSLWDDLRQLYAQTRAAVAARKAAQQSQAAIEKAVRAVELLVSVEPSADDPLETLARVPPVSQLDPVALGLRKAVREGEQRLAGLKSAVESLSFAALKPVGAPGGLLHAQTEADVARGEADAADAREAGEAARHAIEPVLERGRLEQKALDGVVAWAGFMDLIRRGNELKDRLLELGVAGIQAYGIQTPSGEFGPYQFEERVNLGDVTLVCRRIGAAPVHVFEARSTGLLGKGPGGVRVKMRAGDGSIVENVIRPTEHTDELRVQLNYLVKTSREHMRVLGKAESGAAAPSWAGRFSAALAAPPALAAAADVHRRTSHRWMSLLADLIDLGHLKERVATYHLFERHVEFVPAVLEVRGKAEQSLREAHERLAYIASRSSRDIETDRLIVPPHLGKENVERLKQRDKAEKDLARIKKLLGIIAGELGLRISHKRLHGRPGIPKLRLLQPMPETIAAMADVLTDAHLAARATELDGLLGTHFAELAPQPEPPPAEGAAATAAESSDVQAHAEAGSDVATVADTQGYLDAGTYAEAPSESAESAAPADPYEAYPSEHLEGFVIDPGAVPETEDTALPMAEPARDEKQEA